MNKLVNADRSNVKVTFFQRRHRIGHDFSLESIFADIRCRLAKKIDSDVKISKFHNNGPLTKIYNIFEAALRQSGNINHITGELHFLDLFMKKETVILTVLDCGMVAKKKGIARYLVKWLYLKLPVRSAKIVTAISEATKQEILEYTKCEPSKISVIPVAVELIYQPFPKAFNSTRPDILQVGTPYNKNIGRTLTVLFENDIEDGFMHGYTENYIRVKAKYDPILIYDTKKIRITSIDSTCSAEVEEPSESFRALRAPTRPNQAVRPHSTTLIGLMPHQ